MNQCNHKKIYIASSFSNLENAQLFRWRLEADGYEVTSRWMLGGHETEDAIGQSIDPPVIARYARFGREDIEDMDDSTASVFLTEEPSGRGGFHVEFGYMLNKSHPIGILGPIPNVFYAHAINEGWAFHTNDEERLLMWLFDVHALRRRW